MLETSNGQIPGSKIPALFRNMLREGTLGVDPQLAQLESLVADISSGSGAGVVLIGPPMAGKTHLGLAIANEVRRSSTPLSFRYYIERDYLDDLRKLWRYDRMVESASSDAPLVEAAARWSDELRIIQESPLLFVDDVGLGYTQMHSYELDGIVRRRRDLGLSTIYAAQTSAWDSMSASVKGAMKSTCKLIEL